MLPSKTTDKFISFKNFLTRLEKSNVFRSTKKNFLVVEFDIYIHWP